MRKLGLTAIIAISSFASNLELKKFDWDSYIIGCNNAGRKYLRVSRTNGDRSTVIWATGQTFEYGFIRKQVSKEHSSKGESCTWGDIAELREEYQKTHMGMDINLHKTRACNDREMASIVNLLYRAPDLRKQQFSYNESPVRSHFVRIEKKNGQYEVQNYHEDLQEQTVKVKGTHRGQVGYREITNYNVTATTPQIKSFVAASGIRTSHNCTNTASEKVPLCPTQLLDNLYGNYNVLMKDLKPLLK